MAGSLKLMHDLDHIKIMNLQSTPKAWQTKLLSFLYNIRSLITLTLTLIPIINWLILIVDLLLTRALKCKQFAIVSAGCSSVVSMISSHLVLFSPLAINVDI